MIFVFGIIALLATTVEWMVQAWSERASADSSYNASLRGRLAHPLELPHPRRHRRRNADLLVQPDHAVPVQDRRSGGLRRHRRLHPLGAPVLPPTGPHCGAGAIATVIAIAAVGVVTGGIVAALEGRAGDPRPRDHR